MLTVACCEKLNLKMVLFRTQKLMLLLRVSNDVLEGNFLFANSKSETFSFLFGLHDSPFSSFFFFHRYLCSCRSNSSMDRYRQLI